MPACLFVPLLLTAHSRRLNPRLRRWPRGPLTYLKEGRLAWPYGDGGPVVVDADVAQVAFPADFRPASSGRGLFTLALLAARIASALRIDQQDLAAEFLCQGTDLLARSGKAILFRTEAGQQRIVVFVQYAHIAIGKQHDAVELLALCHGEQALQPGAVGDQAVFEFAVASRFWQEMVVIRGQVDGGKQHAAVFPVGIFRIAAELRRR